MSVETANYVLKSCMGGDVKRLLRCVGRVGGDSKFVVFVILPEAEVRAKKEVNADVDKEDPTT